MHAFALRENIIRGGVLSQSGAKEPARPSACNLSVPVVWRRTPLALDGPESRNPNIFRSPQTLDRIHPLGKAPVIEDGALMIAESGAIIEYVIATYGARKFKCWIVIIVWASQNYFYLFYSQLLAGRPLVDNLSCLRIRRSGHAHEAAKPILEIEKLLKGHVQEAVEFTQHLLCPLAKRLALWNEGNKNPPLVGLITPTPNPFFSIRLSIGESVPRSKVQVRSTTPWEPRSQSATRTRYCGYVTPSFLRNGGLLDIAEVRKRHAQIETPPTPLS